MSKISYDFKGIILVNIDIYESPINNKGGNMQPELMLKISFLALRFDL